VGDLADNTKDFYDASDDGAGQYVIVGGDSTPDGYVEEGDFINDKVEGSDFTNVLTTRHSAAGDVLRAVVRGTGKYVAVGDGGEIRDSTNGTSWVAQTAAGAYAGNFQDIAWNAVNLYCAVGASAEIQTSPDGVTWTARTKAGAYAGTFNCVAHGGGLWVIMGADEIQTSPDGITWTARTVPTGTHTWVSVGHDGTRFVAVSSLDKITTSTDGITWTAVTTLPTGACDIAQSIEWWARIGLWIIVGSDTGVTTEKIIVGDPVHNFWVEVKAPETAFVQPLGVHAGPDRLFIIRDNSLYVSQRYDMIERA